MNYPKIVYVDYTYAETCNGEIRIHKDLQYYSKELFQHAINHEIGHQGKTVLQDIMWDLKDLTNIKIHLKALVFYLKYPKLIIRMVSAVHFDKKRRVIEVNYVLLFLYVFYVCIFFILFW